MHIYYDIICLKLLKLKISNMFQKNNDAINKVYFRERFMDLKKITAGPLFFSIILK
jgi:hypothetical protein